MSKKQASNRRGGSTMNLMQSPDRRSRLRRPGIPVRKIPFVSTFTNTALRLCASSDIPSSTKDKADDNEEPNCSRKHKPKYDYSNSFHQASEGSDFMSDSSVAPQSELDTSRTSQLGLLKYEQTSSPFEVQQRPDEQQLSRSSSSSCLSSMSCLKISEDPRVSETLLGAIESERNSRRRFRRPWPKEFNKRSKAPVLHELEDGLPKLDVAAKLVFKQVPDRKSLRAVLTLNNVSRAPVTFSIGTSAPDKIATCPSLGIIDPRSSTHVILKLVDRSSAAEAVYQQVRVEAMALKTAVLLDSRKRLEQFWQAIEAEVIPRDRIEKHVIQQISVQDKDKITNSAYADLPTSCCPMMMDWGQKASKIKALQRSKAHKASMSQVRKTQIPADSRAAALAAETLASDIRTTSAWFVLSLFALILLLFSNGPKLPALSEDDGEGEEGQWFLADYGLDFDLNSWFEAFVEAFANATWPQECLEILGELFDWVAEQVPPSFASVVSLEFLA